MGLASKLAAANAPGGGAPGGPPAPSSYGAAPPPSYGQPQPHPQPGGARPPTQYGAAPPASTYPGQQQPQSSYPGQQSYGQPPHSPPRPQAYQPPGGPPPGSRPASYGQAPSGYGAPQGPPPGQYGQPPQSQYGQPPRPPQQRQQPQQQYGQQPQYGAPPPAPGGGTGDARFISTLLAQCVQEQKISSFYPPGSTEQIAQRVAQSGALDRVAAEWKLPKEIAADLCKLALFDIVLYVDDSGSMAFEQGGERIDDLKLIVGRVAYAASLFDQDGIQVRFMNANNEGNGIKDENGATGLLSGIRYSGLTPLGTSMDRKILQPLVLGPARAGQLQKPVLIITITDGAPSGEDRYTIAKVIVNAVRELSRTRYGPDALSFQFAQVGNDTKAQEFLAELDNHPEIGSLLDSTSEYELESAEMARKGQDLTPELWLVKMLLGGIDDSYDEKDETVRQ